MKLICHKYEFTAISINPFDALSKDNVNFLNEDITKVEIASVDLCDYMILDSLKDNSFSRPQIDAIDKIFYFEAKSFYLDVSAAKDNGYMSDFFEVFSKNINFKWFVEEYDDDNILTNVGYIYNDNIKMPSTQERVINLEVYPKEREFGWYKNVPLTNEAELGFQNIFTGAGFENKFKGLRLVTLLRLLMPNVVMHFEEDMEEWFAGNIPYFYFPKTDWTNETMDMMNGYNSFFAQGTSCFDFFNGICKSMLWKWLFYKGELYVKNYSTQEPIIEIDYNEVIMESGVESSFLNLAVENIIISNGNVRGGKNSSAWYPYPLIFVPLVLPKPTIDTTGNRKVIYSANYFNGINNKLTAGSYNYSVADDGTYTGNPTGAFGYGVLVEKENNDNYKFLVVIAQGVETVNAEGYANYSKDNTLFIDVPINTAEVGRIDMAGARKFEPFPAPFGTPYTIYNGNYIVNNENDALDSEFTLQYTGNVANCLFKVNQDTGKHVSYNWYINYSRLFPANGQALLANQLQQRFTIKGHRALTNPLVRIKIVNYPKTFTNLDDVIFNLYDLQYNLVQQTFEIQIAS